MNPDLSISHGVTIGVPPMFPSYVHVGGASIKLNADGTWEGDRDAFLAAVSAHKQDGTAITMPLLWLIANTIRNR